jgi:CelD/BcsL family acetyltransferase involved in cellulose biosynthesis
VWHDSLLIGVAPLLIYRERSDSVLAFAGGAVSDYLDMLIEPLYAEEALAAIWDAIQSQGDAWDQLELTDVPQTSALLRNARHLELHPHDSCPVLKLPSSLHELSSAIPAHKLRNFRNAKRRLGEAGSLKVEVANPTNQEDALSALFSLHSDRWARSGQEGVLSRPEVQQFHWQVAVPLIEQGILRLYILRLDIKVIAMLYAFFEKDRVYCYLQGYDPEYRKLSPGTFVLGTVIEDAVRHGASSIDFLRGRESYKYSWGAQDVPTFRLQTRRIGP